jgi:hypothetical protein
MLKVEISETRLGLHPPKTQKPVGVIPSRVGIIPTRERIIPTRVKVIPTRVGIIAFFLGGD